MKTSLSRTMVATGSYNLQGTVLTADGPKTFCKGGAGVPKPKSLTGVVTSREFKIGGSYSTAAGTLLNYKAGNNRWSNLVCLPKHTRFHLKLISPGDVYEMARIRVVVFEDDDIDLETLECRNKLHDLVDRYGKELVESQLNWVSTIELND